MTPAEPDVAEDGGADAPARVRAEKPERKLFKPLTFAFLASYPALVLGSLLWRWQFGVVALLLLLPPKLLLLQWWRGSAHACPLEHVLSSFGQGFWLLAGIAVASGLPAFELTRGVVEVLLFSAGLPSLYVYVCSLLAGFGAFIAVEEVWKLNFARWAMYKRQHRLGPASAKGFAIATVATSLGHACAISLLLSLYVSWLMVHMAAVARDEARGAGARAYADAIPDIDFDWLVFWAFVFAGVAMPLNVACAYEVALRLSALGARELRIERGPRADGVGVGPSLCAPAALLRVLAWPVAGRTLFLAQVPLWLLALPPLGAAALIGLSGGCLYCGTVLRVRALEEGLPRVRGGELQRFGFALLADEPAHAEADAEHAAVELGAVPGAPEEGAERERAPLPRPPAVAVPAAPAEVGAVPVAEATPDSRAPDSLSPSGGAGTAAQAARSEASSPALSPAMGVGAGSAGALSHPSQPGSAEPSPAHHAPRDAGPCAEASAVAVAAPAASPDADLR